MGTRRAEQQLECRKDQRVSLPVENVRKLQCRGVRGLATGALGHLEGLSGWEARAEYHGQTTPLERQELGPEVAC